MSSQISTFPINRYTPTEFLWESDVQFNQPRHISNQPPSWADIDTSVNMGEGTRRTMNRPNQYRQHQPDCHFEQQHNDVFSSMGFWEDPNAKGKNRGNFNEHYQNHQYYHHQQHQQNFRNGQSVFNQRPEYPKPTIDVFANVGQWDGNKTPVPKPLQVDVTPVNSTAPSSSSQPFLRNSISPSESLLSSELFGSEEKNSWKVFDDMMKTSRSPSLESKSPLGGLRTSNLQ